MVGKIGSERMKVTGLELLEKIQNEGLKNNTKINVYKDSKDD